MTDSNASTWGMPTPGQAASTPEPLDHIEQARLEGVTSSATLSTRPPTANPAPFAPDTAAEQLAYQRGQQDAVRQLTTPRMTGWRITCGICWGKLLDLAFYHRRFRKPGAGQFGFIPARRSPGGPRGWYDYRIWALKARRLDPVHHLLTDIPDTKEDVRDVAQRLVTVRDIGDTEVVSNTGVARWHTPLPRARRIRPARVLLYRFPAQPEGRAAQSEARPTPPDGLRSFHLRQPS